MVKSAYLPWSIPSPAPSPSTLGQASLSPAGGAVNADEDEFTRLFLICNDWNLISHSATAYCRANDDGLHVHVDVPTLIGAGLSQEQLQRVLSQSLDAILHAIDEIAREFCGSSPVKWA